MEIGNSISFFKSEASDLHYFFVFQYRMSLLLDLSVDNYVYSNVFLIRDYLNQRFI